MSSVNLLPGDKYDGRCAEIYITEKQFLIYHCSACEDIFTTFTELLSHITKDHYENTKELSKADIKNAETANKHENSKENQFTANNLYVKDRKSDNNFERKIENKDEQSSNRLFSGTFWKKNPVEKIAPPSHPGKSLSHRKKIRYVAGAYKNNALGRNVTMLTRYQACHNDERKYVCAICGFAFKEKYNLRGHLMRHSNQKHISCSTCPKKFYTKVDLCLHDYRHKSERQYVCDRCGMVLSSSVTFTQHLRKDHYIHQLFKCDQCFKLCSSLHQVQDYNTLSSEIICMECSLSLKYEGFFKYPKELQESQHNSGKELFVEKNKINKENNSSKQVQNDNLKERAIEDEFILEQNFDEYELVQTLSDLECSKHV